MVSTRSNATTADGEQPSQPPTIREIAALTRRLRGLTGQDADPAERAAFLADKAALLARITHHNTDDNRDAGPRRHDRNGGDR